MIALLPSLVMAGLIAWWITRREGWPVMAVLVQLSFHFLWAGVLIGDLEMDDASAGPLASGLGVLTIVAISLLLRLVARRPPRRDEVFGVVRPESVEPEKEPAATLPRAQVVKGPGRRRHSAYRRSTLGDRRPRNAP